MRIVFGEAAVADLADIHAWIGKENPRAADRLIAHFRQGRQPSHA
jgi:plasmid stabilization system protein ParE